MDMYSKDLKISLNIKYDWSEKNSHLNGIIDYDSVTIKILRLFIILRTSPSAHFSLIFQFKSIWSYISWKDVVTEI